MYQKNFCNIFQYDPDYLDIIEREIFSPFWKNILTALKVLWKSSMVIDKDCVLYTPLCYHPELQLQIIPEWNNKGNYNGMGPTKSK